VNQTLPWGGGGPEVAPGGSRVRGIYHSDDGEKQAHFERGFRDAGKSRTSRLEAN
jgi:hypothetical protein